MDILEKVEDFQVEPVKRIMCNAKEAQPRGIVFFGDSLIQGFDVHRYFSGNIYNCGCDGATSDLLLHLQPYAVADYKPSKVILLIGTNDLSDRWQFDKLESAFNVFKLIDIMRKKDAGIDVVVVSPLPIIESLKKTQCRNNRQLRLLSQEYASIAKEFVNVAFVDVFDAFLQDGQLNADYTSDGLHLNEKGYDVLAQYLRPYVE